MNDIRYAVIFCNQSSFQHGPEYRNQRQNDFVFQDLITVHKDAILCLHNLFSRNLLNHFDLVAVLSKPRFGHLLARSSV